MNKKRSERNEIKKLSSTFYAVEQTLTWLWHERLRNLPGGKKWNFDSLPFFVAFSPVGQEMPASWRGDEEEIKANDDPFTLVEIG